MFFSGSIAPGAACGLPSTDMAFSGFPSAGNGQDTRPAMARYKASSLAPPRRRAAERPAGRRTRSTASDCVSRSGASRPGPVTSFCFTPMRSEALTHPYLAHAWAERGADLRVEAPGQAHKVAMMGVLDAMTRELIVQTSVTKRSTDFIAI